MSFRKYITSKVFFGQLAIAFIIITLLTFLFLNMLSFFTNHGQEIKVPNLSKLTVEQAEEMLEDLNLDYVLLDTLDFDASFPEYTVMLQDPKAGAKVKKGRKVYFKINSNGYVDVVLPDLIEKTFRQAEPTLKALGLELGQVTYRPYLGKDMVLEMRMDGKIVKPGTKVMKTSRIDLVLGDGEIGYEEEIDSLETDRIILDEQ